MTEFADHFSTLSKRYANFRPNYPKPLFTYLATITKGRTGASPVPAGAPPTTTTVWDCACGSGQASIDLAEHFDRVIATDASPQQIASAKPHPKIDYRVAPAENSGLPDASADLITVAQALHWLNLPRFYTDAKRVLRPGGLIAVWTYGASIIDLTTADELFQDFYSNVIGPYWPPERIIVEEGYRTIDFPFQELTPPRFDMITTWTLHELIGYLSTWSGVKRYTEARGQSPLPQLEAQMFLVWGDPQIRRQITWPLSMRVGSAGR